MVLLQLWLHIYSKQTLKERVAALIPPKQEQVKKLKTEYGEKILSTCTVSQVHFTSLVATWS